MIIEKNILTENLTPERVFFGEQVRVLNGIEYRVLDPLRSKLGAGIAKLQKARVNVLPLLPVKNASVIYLGASAGYTVSFVSDMVPAGGVFAIDNAPRMVRDLVFLSEERRNIAPLLDDANRPEEYADRVLPADWMFQDVAQKNQVEIALKNLRFLKPNGLFWIAIKARSIDFAAKPEDVFAEAKKQLLTHVQIVAEVSLEPYHKGHWLFVVRKK